MHLCLKLLQYELSDCLSRDKNGVNLNLCHSKGKREISTCSNNELKVNFFKKTIKSINLD